MVEKEEQEGGSECLAVGQSSELACSRRQGKWPLMTPNDVAMGVPGTRPRRDTPAEVPVNEQGIGSGWNVKYVLWWTL